ncbi:leucine-rich repeat-containing protein 73-like [Glandiceps talaboti]
MLLGSVQISGESLSSREVSDICESLENHSMRLLSLRGCKISEKDFKRIAAAVGLCTSILQLNFNLGVITCVARVKLLTEALNKNRSLQALFLHGNHFGDDGLEILSKGLSMHPSLVSLDVGDCCLGDKGIRMISNLLPDDGAKSGLKELILSANPDITTNGWAHFAIAMAASSTIRILHVDYNHIGDYGAGLFAVAIASSKDLEVMDLEATGITEQGGKVLLDLVKNYPTPLRQLNIRENYVSRKVGNKINQLLGFENEEEEEEDDDDDDEASNSSSPSPPSSSSSTASSSESEEEEAAKDDEGKDDKHRVVKLKKDSASNAEKADSDSRNSGHTVSGDSSQQGASSSSTSSSSSTNNNSNHPVRLSDLVGAHLDRSGRLNRSVTWRSPPVYDEQQNMTSRSEGQQSLQSTPRKYRPLPIPTGPIKV